MAFVECYKSSMSVCESVCELMSHNIIIIIVIRNMIVFQVRHFDFCLLNKNRVKEENIIGKCVLNILHLDKTKKE